MGGRGSSGRSRKSQDNQRDPLLPDNATFIRNEPTEPAEPAAESAADKIRAKQHAAILDAYQRLSVKPQDWVRLVDLRRHLFDTGMSKHKVDNVLLDLCRTGKAHLAPDSNRKALTGADHTAAIHLGGEAKHLIAINPNLLGSRPQKGNPS